MSIDLPSLFLFPPPQKGSIFLIDLLFHNIASERTFLFVVTVPRSSFLKSAWALLLTVCAVHSQSIKSIKSAVKCLQEELIKSSEFFACVAKKEREIRMQRGGPSRLTVCLLIPPNDGWEAGRRREEKS